MSIKVEAKGLACPMPVIETKRALENLTEGIVEVNVDNVTARENILKFAKSVNCDAEVTKDEEKDILIKIIKGENDKIDIKDEDIKCDVSSSNESGEVILFTSNKIGSGNDELGGVLIKGFMFTLTETKPLPRAMLFLNGGVELTTINEATVEHIKSLESMGVEVLSCGTCLDYYNLKDELKVGSVTNMYTIVETMKNSSKLITIG